MPDLRIGGEQAGGEHRGDRLEFRQRLGGAPGGRQRRRGADAWLDGRGRLHEDALVGGQLGIVLAEMLVAAAEMEVDLRHDHLVVTEPAPRLLEQLLGREPFSLRHQPLTVDQQEHRMGWFEHLAQPVDGQRRFLQVLLHEGGLGQHEQHRRPAGGRGQPLAQHLHRLGRPILLEVDGRQLAVSPLVVGKQLAAAVRRVDGLGDVPVGQLQVEEREQRRPVFRVDFQGPVDGLARRGDVVHLAMPVRQRQPGFGLLSVGLDHLVDDDAGGFLVVELVEQELREHGETIGRADPSAVLVELPRFAIEADERSGLVGRLLVLAHGRHGTDEHQLNRERMREVLAVPLGGRRGVRGGGVRQGVLGGEDVEVLPGGGGLADEHLKPGQAAAQRVVVGVAADRGLGQAVRARDVLSAELAGAGPLEREIGEFRHDRVVARPDGEVPLEHGNRLQRTIGLRRLMGEHDQAAGVPPALEPPDGEDPGQPDDARHDQRQQEAKIDAFHGENTPGPAIEQRSLDLPTSAFYQSHPPRR